MVFDMAILSRAKYPSFDRFLSLFRANSFIFSSNTAFFNLCENARLVIARNHTRYKLKSRQMRTFFPLFERCSSLVSAASATSLLILSLSRGDFRCIFKEETFVCNKSASMYKSVKRFCYTKLMQEFANYKKN